MMVREPTLMDLSVEAQVFVEARVKEITSGF